MNDFKDKKTMKYLHGNSLEHPPPPTPQSPEPSTALSFVQPCYSHVKHHDPTEWCYFSRAGGFVKKVELETEAPAKQVKTTPKAVKREWNLSLKALF